MTKSQRFKPVVEVAESRELAAAKVFGEAQRILRERREKLQELFTYREEYAQKFLQTGAIGMSANEMQSFRNFLAKLDAAIAQQQQLVANAMKTLEEKKRLWLLQNSKKQTLEKVVDKYREQENHANSKKEQREADERAQRRTKVKE